MLPDVGGNPSMISKGDLVGIKYKNN